MEQSRNASKIINGRLINRKERIKSDTDLLPLPKRRRSVLNQFKVASRVPLQDLATNVLKLDVERKSDSSNAKDTCSNCKTKNVVITGYISKVTENRLKLRDTYKPASTSTQEPPNKPKIQKSSSQCTYSKNKYADISKNPLVKVQGVDAKLLDSSSTSSSTVIFQDFKKPARKTTIFRKRKTGACILDVDDTEYLESIIGYQLQNDWKYVLTKNALKTNHGLRTAIVHTLIKVIEDLKQPTSILFPTVRLFDFIVETLDVPSSMLQLISFVVMWIVIKLDNNTNFPSVQKFVTLCSNVYTVSDILGMEKKILKFLDFNINVSDVTIYSNYYIMKLTGTCDLLHYSVEYILECYTLNKHFSTVIPSKQAAGAVCLALDILQPPALLWHTLTDTLGYYNKKELKEIMDVMLEQIHKIQDPRYEYRYPYEKYAVKEKHQVSFVLLGKLIAS